MSFLKTALRHGGAALVGGNAVQALAAFAVNLVLVRVLTPDDFGRFAVVLAGAGLILTLVALRINVLIVRRCESELNSQSVSLYFSVACVETALAALATLGWLYAAGHFDAPAVALVLAAALNHWLGSVRAFTERQMVFGRLARAETAAALLAHGLCLGLAMSGAGAAALYAREAAAALLGMAALRMAGGRLLFPFRLPSLAQWRAIMREAAGVWIDGAAEGGFPRLVTLSVAAFGGEAVTGYLFQAQRLAVVPQQFLGPLIHRLSANWFRIMRDQQPGGAGRARFGAYGVLAPVLAAGAVLAVVMGEPVIVFIYGSAWKPVADCLAWMAGVAACACLYDLARIYCLSHHRHGALIVGRVVQYAAFAAGLVPAWMGALPVAESAALGLSLSSILPFIFVELALARRG